MKHVIGVDMGGTWMRAASVARDGKCGRLARKPTLSGRAPEAIADDLAELIESVRGVRGRRDNVRGVSVGVPTVLDVNGRLASSGNIPTMAGFDIRGVLSDRLGLPVMLFNDADCFTVGEWWMGAGTGTRNFCGVTLGTGIGVGLVLDGRLFTGSHGAAGEIWNVPWGRGCVEQAACGGAIEAAYAKRAGRRKTPGEQIHRLAERGDRDALAVYADFGRNLGRILAFIVALLDLEAIAIGGSVAASFRFFGDALVEALPEGTRTRIEAGRLGERAALLGSSRLFHEKTREAQNRK